MLQNSAFLAVPDGSPLSLVQRLRGYTAAEQVPGPDLMPALWKVTENQEISHYFYGSTETTITRLKNRLKEEYPNLKIAGMESPPSENLQSKRMKKLSKELINQEQILCGWVWELPSRNSGCFIIGEE